MTTAEKIAQLEQALAQHQQAAANHQAMAHRLSGRLDVLRELLKDEEEAAQTEATTKPKGKRGRPRKKAAEATEAPPAEAPQQDGQE